METSANFNATHTRNNIIEDAAEIAGILDPDGGELTPLQYSRIARYLNNMIKSWQADGMQVWVRRYFGVILTKNRATYTFSWDKADYRRQPWSRNIIPTTFVSGAGTTINVTSTAGMTATSTFSGTATYIAIEQNSGNFHFDTIVQVNTNTQLTLGTGGTDYKPNGFVYFYPDLCPRILRLLDGWVRTPRGADTPVKVLAREEYNRFGMKTSTGITTQVFYDMGWPESTLYVYPVPNTNGNILWLEGMFPFQVFTNPSDLPDFPEEWQNAIIYGLAVEIGYRYGMDEKRLTKIEQLARYWRDMALGMSQENSVYLQPTANLYGKK